MLTRAAVLATPIVTLLLTACQGARPTYVPADRLSDEWRTTAERTAYEETGTYAEAVAFCRRLAATSPYARYATFGLSGEGRELPLLILSSEGAFRPEAAQRSDRPLVLIQNCIHPGECEGKDACLELARGILVTGEQADLLAHANVLIIPIYNVDGHERRGAYNRANQNGPREMGWRATATNLDLNRDYLKADAAETRAWLRLWQAWQPDLFIDDHTTDGHDHRYSVFYTATTGPDVPEAVAAWTRDRLLAAVLPGLEAAGFATLPYSFPRNVKDPAEGMVAAAPMPPRFSTGYAAACNRASLLVETHARLPYGRRVQATHALLVRALEAVNRSGAELRRVVRAADAEAARTRGAASDGQVPLRFEIGDAPRRFIYKALELHARPSEIMGDEVVEYTRTPVDIESNLYEQPRVTLAVAPPAAYLIPPQWTEVIARLELHGIRHFRLTSPAALDVESCWFEDVKFEPESYQGRLTPHFKTVPMRERRDCVAGTVVVPLDQPRARLALHVLEPDAPDSCVAWGFCNAIFEQRENAEAYVMEPLARQMLAEDPALRWEFEQRLKQDEAFAKEPWQRLNFFYLRSKYADPRKDVYPVGRLTDADALRRLAAK
jgi:hypothetical protein